MRHFLPTILLLLISAVSAYAQQADSSPAASIEPSTNTSSNIYKQTKEWKRCKVLRAIGWTSLGVGIPTTLVGVYITGAQSIEGGTSAVGVPIIVTGGILMVASAPLLIASNYFKRKAKRLQMSMSTIEVPKYIDRTSCVPSLRLALTF